MASDKLLNINKIEIGNMQVEFKYSQNSKTISECIINILKQKMK